MIQFEIQLETFKDKKNLVRKFNNLILTKQDYSMHVQ